jgi:hypothetical protein
VRWVRCGKRQSEASAKGGEQDAARYHRSREPHDVQAGRLCSRAPVGVVEAPGKRQFSARYFVEEDASKRSRLNFSDAVCTFDCPLLAPSRSPSPFIVDGDMLRIVMSSIMRRRSGVICLLIGELLSDKLHERAILTDRTTVTDSADFAPDTGWGAKVILCDVSKMALLSHSLPSPQWSKCCILYDRCLGTQRAELAVQNLMGSDRAIGGRHTVTRAKSEWSICLRSLRASA